VDLTGNLIAVVDPDVSSVSVPFHPFQANQLPMDVLVRDVADTATGVLAFTKCPRSSSAVEERPPTPVCLLRATLPDGMWTPPKLRKSRQQGAAGDVEYTPPDAETTEKLEWPGPDEPEENALPVHAVYAEKPLKLRIPPSKRVVEGDIKTRREVTEEQQAMSDGSTVKRQIAVVTSFRPITEFPSREDDTKEPAVHEKIVRVDVEENSVNLPPGVVEPYGSNVVAKLRTDKYDDVLPDGVPRTRTVTTLSVELKPSSDEIVPVDTSIEPEYEKRPLQQPPPPPLKSALERMEDLLKSGEADISPSIDETDVGKSPVVLIEGGRGTPRISRRFGAVSPRTEVSEDEQTLNDGTTLKWKTTTTKHAAPVFEVSELEGRTSERQIGEQLIQTDIQEVVMRMAPGILYPYGSDIESETSETHFEDTLPDGSKVKKNVVNIDVRNVKPDAVDTFETAPVDAYGRALDTGSTKDFPDGQRKTKLEQYVQQPRVVDGKADGKPAVSSERPASAQDRGIGLPAAAGPETGVPLKTTKEYRRGLNNGDVLIRKVTTTQRIEPTADGDTAADGMTSPKVVGTEVEENVLKLPCGSIDAGGNNLQCDINVAKSDEQTPDGIPVSKKTVTADVRLKTKPSRIVKGDTQSRLKTLEDRRNLDDGTLVAEKTTETDYFKPVVEVRCVDGKEVRLPLREEPVKVESLRNVLELHPGVIEPFGSNVSTDVTVDSFDDQLPNGIPVKRKLVKLVVTPNKEDSSPTADEAQPQPEGAITQTPGVPEVIPSPEDNAGKVPRADTGVPLPQVQTPGEIVKPGVEDAHARPIVTDGVQKKIIEGPVKSKTDVSEDERPLPNGGTLKHKAVTISHIKPIEEVAVINGRPAGSIFREEVVDKEIEDSYVELPAGVKSAYGLDVESETTLDRLDDDVIDGIPVKRTVRRTKVHRKPVSTTPALRDLLHEIEKTVADTETAAVNKINALLSPTETTLEEAPDGAKPLDKVIPAKVIPSPDGEVRSRTSVLEFQRCLEDGTMIRRIVAVTQHYVPTTPELPAGVTGDVAAVRKGERLIDVEIDENLIALPPGVAEPNGDNCDTTIVVQKSERTLADGTPVRKTAATTVVTLKPPKTRLIEGDIEHRTNVEQDQKCLPDGSTIRRKIITTRKIQPVSEVTVTDGKEIIKFLREKVVGATIEENILELPPGVIEPSGANCETDITVSESDDALTDGTPAKRKIVRMVVRIKGQTKPDKPPTDVKAATEPQITTAVDGPIRSESETKQYEENLEDGTTIARKIITTKHIKAVAERRSPGHGMPADSVTTRDKVVSVDIEENILQLPPGVIEPFAKNCDNDIEVDHFEQTSVDGVVVRRKVVKMTVRLKQPEEAKPSAPAMRTVEGDAVERVDVKESEKILDDGTKSSTKRFTKKRVQPVTDVTVVDGVPTVTNYREVTLDATIDEIVQELGPGVTEPRETDKVTATINVEQSDETLPDGTQAVKTVTTTSYRRTAEPEVTQKFIEGPVEARTDVGEDSKRLDDGTVVKRRVETTKFVKPVRVITRTDGVVTDSRVQEEVVSTEVNERVTEMLPGVVEPFGDDVQTSSSEQYFQETMPDGSPLNKKVVKVTASLRPHGNPGTEDKVRRIGPDGEMVDTERRAGSPVSDDGTLMSPTDGPSPVGSELDLRMFGVYADVVETEPQVEKDVQEYEETLPDSTVVRKRIVTTVEKKTVLMRALLPEDQETGVSTEPLVQRYVDVTAEEPQVVTDIYDTAETMPDGELAKKRVKTTGQRRLTTERKLISGQLQDDQFTDQLQTAERQPGLTQFCFCVLQLITYRQSLIIFT